MPLGASDEDLTPARKALIRGVVSYALGGVTVLVYDLDKVDEFLNGTGALQQLLAADFLCLAFSLLAFCAFNLIMFVYYLPSRFRPPRKTIGFFCLWGAISFGLWKVI